MKPNRFETFLNSMLLAGLIFVSAAIGQTPVTKIESGNSGNENKTSQTQSSSESRVQTINVKTSDDRYRIGLQDTIQVTVYKHPQLSGVHSISPGGTIFLPKLDEPVVAVCKTERELADDIAAAYKKNYLRNPFVDVRAVDQKSQAFAVIGAVEKPGYFYMNRKVHLLELLSFAGGPNDTAGTQLIVARTGGSSSCRDDGTIAASRNDDDPEIELLNFKLKDVKEARQYLWMKPGDIVSVLEADPFYVTGNVNKPGMFYLKGPTTLMQALATAEGFKPASKKDNIRILRQKPNSTEREDLVFKLKDIEDKKIADPLLQANDIVAVSEDRVKSIINGITKSVTGGLGNLPFIIP